jgi:hypothetical protein
VLSHEQLQLALRGTPLLLLLLLLLLVATVLRLYVVPQCGLDFC